MTTPPSPTVSLSAIIPSLNEEATITDAVASLRTSCSFLEIVVADGGSTDATRRLAKSAGARVVHCKKRGRGVQIAEAWGTCSGEALVVLHADVRFPHHMETYRSGKRWHPPMFRGEPSPWLLSPPRKKPASSPS